MKKETKRNMENETKKTLPTQKRAYEKPRILEEEKLETLSLGCEKSSPFSCPAQAPTP